MIRHAPAARLLCCLTLTRRLPSLLCGLLLSALPVFAVQADSAPLTLPQILQQVLNHSPSLQSAALQVEKAQQDSVQIQSRLGWQLGAQAGISKDVSVFGSAVNRINAGTELSRLLESGENVSIAASINRDDADTSTLPTLPNPATTTSIELQYRKPLRQGKGNPEFALGLTQAESNVEIFKAQQQAAYDQIAAQLIELYTAALATQQRIDNIKQSIQRNYRLQKFIDDRVDLGIAEDKDELQTEAQLHGLQAQLKALELVSIKQNIIFNRLMGRPWQTPLALKTEKPGPPPANLTTLKEQVNQHSPALMINTARMTLTESMIERQRDKNLDRLDMVLSIGNQTQNGDSATGSVTDSEVVGGVQLEFGQARDKSGTRAALYQAQLDRSITLQDRKQINDDLYYDLATRVSELKAIQATIKAYRRSVKSEHAKLDEAENRYRRGRITIDQVIQFENQTAASELELALQQIDYLRSRNQLDLLRGALWDNITIPPHHNGNGRH
jgi:outer membrane protein TolC